MEILVPESVMGTQPAGTGRPYTDLVEQNIVDWKAALRGQFCNTCLLGKCIVFPSDRTPSERTVWGSSLPKPGMFPCLTAAGPVLHICSLGEGTDTPSLDRPVHKFERGAAQGVPRALCQLGISDILARRIFGNAMSLPVVGTVIANELCSLERAGALGRATFSGRRACSARPLPMQVPLSAARTFRG